MTCRVYRAALLLALLTLAACDRVTRTEPFTDTRLPPGLETRYWPPSSWTYGLLQVGDEQVRYGVAAPQGVARADVILLPSHAESAEMWFETASELVTAGHTVWILEAAGEGGGSRSALARETVHAAKSETDIRALVALHRLIIRPKGPVGVVASGTAALPAAGALQRGYAPDVLILSGPFEPRTQDWKRPEPTDAMTARRRATSSWALANPDLRMGGVSRGWRKERTLLEKQLAEGPGLAAGVKVRIIAPDDGTLGCQSMADCNVTILPSNEAYAFEQDAVRDQWMALVRASLP